MNGPDPRKSKAALVAELEAAVEEIPGNKYEFTPTYTDALQ